MKVKSKPSRRRLAQLADRASELSRGQCPEPDTTYWSGFAHALHYALGHYGDDIYAIEYLEKKAHE